MFSAGKDICSEGIFFGHYARIEFHSLLRGIGIAVMRLRSAGCQESVRIGIRRIDDPGRIRVPAPVDCVGGIGIEKTAGAECSYIDDDIVSSDACIERRATAKGESCY